ncbi:MAG: hypothetical protein ACK4P3_09595 [Fimbriimonadaceae bacterium]
MNRIKNFLTVCTGVCLLAAMAAAQPNVVGTFNGRVSIDESQVKIKDPQQRKQFESMLGDFRSIRLELVVNRDRTFRITRSGPNKLVVTGTWTQKGNQLTLKELRHNGKELPEKLQAESNFTVSSDGRTITQADRSPMALRVTYTRAR